MSGQFDKANAHYRIGPLTVYVDPTDLERQFRRAQAGERVTYAIGPALGTGSPTAMMVRRWQEQGLCHLSRARDDNGWRYFLEKRPLAASQANEVSLGRCIRDRPEERLLEVLEGLADSGEAMPSLDRLADSADLPHRHAAAYRLRLLVEGGFIRLRQEGVFRFAEILKQEVGG